MSTNLFQKFFEKALGPKEKPKKKKDKGEKKGSFKRRDTLPRVSYNPVVAMFGNQPKGMDCSKEFVAMPKTILKLDSNHFALNQILEKKALVDKSRLDYMDIKNMLTLDYEKGWQYKIILEGGLLLCQLKEVHRDRENLLKHLKSFMKKAVRSRHDNIGELEELVNSVTPFSIQDQDTEHMPNPILHVLVDSLYHQYKRVKEAFQSAQAQAFVAEE